MASGATPNIWQQVSFIWGISNDQYSWPGNHFWDGRNIDIRSNSREVALTQQMSYQTQTLSEIPLCIYVDTLSTNPALIWTETWYLDTSSLTNMYKRIGTSKDYQNITRYWDSMFIMSNKYIDSFPAPSGSSREDVLWTSEITSNPTGWTWWAWWSLGWSTWTHSSGTATLVDNVGTVTTAKNNRIQITHTGTVGTCTVTCWWTTFGTLSSSNTWTVTFYGTTVSAGKLTFTPSTTYNGAISNVTVYETSMTENKWTFNQTNDRKPYLVFKGNLLIGDWYQIVQITWTWSAFVPTSWALTNYVRIWIDSAESILGIYELWDQVVFFTDKAQYFRDWFNEAYDRRVPWDDTIVATCQDWTAFYVTTQSLHTTLWKCSTGYDRIPIIKDVVTGDTQSKFISEYPSYASSMINLWGIKYLTGWPVGEINTYWSYNPWMPESWMKLKTGYGYVTALWAYNYGSNGWVLYYWWFSWSTYYLDTITTDTRDTPNSTDREWLLVLTPEIWSSESANKVMEKVRLWYNFREWTWSKACIYATLDDETDRWSFCVGNPTVVPTPWATYTYSGDTYTVINVFEGTDWHTYIGTQCNANLESQGYSGTLTKASWTGDATLAFSYVVKGRLVASIDGTDSAIRAAKRASFMYSEPFNKIQFSISLERTVYGSVPKLFDFIWEYTEIQNDL